MDRLPDSDQESQIQEGKVFAVLGYLSILCIIPLLFRKENQFVLCHSRQGLVLFVGQVGLFILHILFPWIWRPGLFIFGVMSFAGIIAVLQGKELKLPVISQIADKITL